MVMLTGRGTKRRVTGVRVVLGLTVGMVFVGGCGGRNGGASAVSRTAPVSIGFDFSRAETSAQLPSTAQSVVITVTQGDRFTDTRVLNRPPQESEASTVTAEFLAFFDGDATVNASAFSGRDGSGEKVADATRTVILGAGRNLRPEFTFSATPYSAIRLLRNGTVLGPTTEVAVDTPTAVTAQGVTGSGTPTDLNPVGTWTSDNPEIAAVTNTGVVTGNNYGTVGIRFTGDRGIFATVAVTVGGAVVDSVRFVPDITTIQQSAVLTANATDSKQRTITTNLNWRWETSNAQVVNFNDGNAVVNGATTVTIRAVGPGVANVTLTETNSGKSFTKTFNVVPVD
ncbi:MAG: Ig-like domain-containing protein [Capsulimonadales bacterium]|nr:Ig-like domain-containing protein [Capsulimonadales bacterium]